MPTKTQKRLMQKKFFKFFVAEENRLVLKIAFPLSFAGIGQNDKNYQEEFDEGGVHK